MQKDIYQNYNQYLVGLLIIIFFFSFISMYFMPSFFIHLKHLSRDQIAGRGNPTIHILIPSLSALPPFLGVYKPVWTCH